MNDPVLAAIVPKRLQNLDRVIAAANAHAEKPISTCALLENLGRLTRSLDSHSDVTIVEARGKAARDCQIRLVAEIPDG